MVITSSSVAKSSKSEQRHMRLLSINGHVFLRLFDNGSFTDYELSPYCLALLVADGAQIMGSVYRQQTAD